MRVSAAPPKVRVVARFRKETQRCFVRRCWPPRPEFCLALAATSSAPAQEPFYKGKRLTILVNFDAGSATDIDARVFARHFIKHVDGAPQLVIQNMPGGGGANGTTYLGEVAPKDGTMVGFLTAAAWSFATEPERFRVDFKNYEHVGNTGGTAVSYMRKDVPPGINKPADIVKAKGLVSGGVNARSGRDISIRLTLDTLGVPFRHVSGYGSGERARLALQRQEIHLYSDTQRPAIVARSKARWSRTAS